MTLLSNELVRRFFGCKESDCSRWHYDNPEISESCMALRVLKAMEEPIKNGEKFLKLYPNDDGTYFGDMVEACFDVDRSYYESKWILRLPSRFQEPKENKGGIPSTVHHLCTCDFCSDLLSKWMEKREKEIQPSPAAKEKNCYCGVHELNLSEPCVVRPSPPAKEEEKSCLGGFWHGSSCGCPRKGKPSPSAEEKHDHVCNFTCDSPVGKHIAHLRQWYIGLFPLMYGEPKNNIDDELEKLVALARRKPDDFGREG